MISIRKATPEDMHAVHTLVRELALFEKSPEEVDTSPEAFRADGFGERPFFECLVAEHPEDGIIGITLYYFGYSTWKGKMLYLDDLVVTQRYRRKGIGSQLMEALIAAAKAAGVTHMRWQVLDWNTPAIEMYKKLGAELDGGWVNCKLPLGEY